MKRSFFLLTVFFLLFVLPSSAVAIPFGVYLETLTNPHQQISDEGNILWNTCTICHPVIPDLDNAKSIEDVRLRSKVDLAGFCAACHPDPSHPGGQAFGKSLGKTGDAPDHLVVPPESIKLNIRKSSLETNVMLPLDPKTGKVFCGTCHNPHERGLLKGKADLGADMVQRLRSGGRVICQFCHRK